MKLPKIGEKIYVPSSYYVYRGEDDFDGGIATISKVDISKTLPLNHINSIMIGIEERKSTMYNYKSLIDEQDELKIQFGNQIAKPNPDLTPDFNDGEADWKYVN